MSFYMTVFCMSCTKSKLVNRGVFRTLSKIEDGAFCKNS